MAVEAYELFHEVDEARKAFIQDSRDTQRADIEGLPDDDFDSARMARIERATLQLPEFFDSPQPAFAGQGACVGQTEVFIIDIYDDENRMRPKKDIKTATKMAQAACASCTIRTECAEYAADNYKWTPNADHLVVMGGIAYAQAHPSSAK